MRYASKGVQVPFVFLRHDRKSRFRHFVSYKTWYPRAMKFVNQWGSPAPKQQHRCRCGRLLGWRVRPQADGLYRCPPCKEARR